MRRSQSRRPKLQRLFLTGLGACIASTSLNAPTRAYAASPPAATDPLPVKAPRKGVGLLISSGIIGTIALQFTVISVPLYLAAIDESNSADPPQSSSGPLDPTGPRNIIIGGLVGLAVSGVMLAGGIAMNQRYHQWKSSGALFRRRYRIAPMMTWRANRGVLGLTGSF